MAFDLTVQDGGSGAVETVTFETTATNLRGGSYDIDATTINVDIDVDTTATNTTYSPAGRSALATAVDLQSSEQPMSPTTAGEQAPMPSTMKQ